MAGKNTAAFGIYRDRAAAEQAIATLCNRGFRSEDVSVLMPENAGNKDLATTKATKGPEGTATGAGTGAVLGGTLGLLAGLGAIAIPGLGPLIAAGPIVAALAGAGAGGVVGGVTGGLIGLGIPEYEAKRYEGRIKNGGVLVSVHCDDSQWTRRAKDILQNTGAEDVSSTSESSADYGESDRAIPRSVTTAGDVPSERSATARNFEDYEPDWRRHYQSNFAATANGYEQIFPAYEFGCLSVMESRYQGKTFDQAEPELRRDYERDYPETPWARIREAVRYGWERVSAKARTARG